MKIQYKILWIDDELIYTRNNEFGDEYFDKEDYPEKKVGEIIEIEINEDCGYSYEKEMKQGELF